MVDTTKRSRNKLNEDSSDYEEYNNEFGFQKDHSRKRQRKMISMQGFESDSSDGVLDEEDDEENRDQKNIGLDNNSEMINKDLNVFEDEDDNNDFLTQLHNTDKNENNEDRTASFNIFKSDDHNGNNPKTSVKINHDSNEQENSLNLNQEIEEIPIEAFNLEDENINGRFDAEGNYTRSIADLKEEEEEKSYQNQDKWIDDYNDDIHQTFEAQRKRTEMVAKKQKEIKKSRRHYMLDVALSRLLYFLKKNKTIMQSISELHNIRNKLNTMNKINKELDRDKTNNEIKKKYISNGIQMIIEIIEILEQKGIENVYELDRPKLLSLIREESLDATDDIDSEKHNYRIKRWQFKWQNDLNKIHGVYTNYEMQYWKQTYFNDQVLIKNVNDKDQENNWVHVSCLTFI
ncbi:hypothetical protein TBLA_0A05600 [Henningerozyma blattae CBS 6284]|uniref:GYF domain-containing protein n=1 Tax=Henningerozyma blattae (strain ATCC 34711 / CBS 6284 / DSM 70876 / NBRC 10599 / NRRL Y-10934 / UCD 77-7) TaxID=1071380 RepID=I2GW51_HENB6|nr:hypothetical protein TBLA_0A05600 [Tetrapisispora blattae CBS 6284]CCH58353.1 hypothetical protein TBLA_0A05600 [Tetrapisispora blattae CBS 6284]